LIEDHGGPAANTSFACSCCGYHTLDREPPGSLAVCPVCYWQDASFDQPSHNLCSLWRAVENFELMRVSHHRWIERVREPVSGERPGCPTRPVDFARLMTSQRDEILQQIAQVFDGVRREEGVTLHEALEMDLYGSPEQCAQARLLDTDENWQEVRGKDLERFPSVLSFLDAKGFRYYLPAYMSWELWRFRALGASIRSWLLFHLDTSESRHFTILTEPQARAVYRYLRFVGDYAWDLNAKVARSALAKYWSRFAPAV
jgi:Cysteine-rich CPCC